MRPVAPPDAPMARRFAGSWQARTHCSRFLVIARLMREIQFFWIASPETTRRPQRRNISVMMGGQEADPALCQRSVACCGGQKAEAGALYNGGQGQGRNRTDPRAFGRAEL